MRQFMLVNKWIFNEDQRIIKIAYQEQLIKSTLNDLTASLSPSLILQAEY